MQSRSFRYNKLKSCVQSRSFRYNKLKSCMQSRTFRYNKLKSCIQSRTFRYNQLKFCIQSRSFRYNKLKSCIESRSFRYNKLKSCIESRSFRYNKLKSCMQSRSFRYNQLKFCIQSRSFRYNKLKSCTAISKKVFIVNSRYWNRKELWGSSSTNNLLLLTLTLQNGERRLITMSRPFGNNPRWRAITYYDCTQSSFRFQYRHFDYGNLFWNRCIQNHSFRYNRLKSCIQSP